MLKGIGCLVLGVMLGATMQSLRAQNALSGGVNHVAVTVDNFDEAMRFYTEKMGFRETFRFTEPRKVAYVQVGRDTFLEISPVAANGRPGIQHIGLLVDDLKSAVARYGERGLQFGEIRTGLSKASVSSATDPFGINFELIEIGPESLQRKAIQSWR